MDIKKFEDELHELWSRYIKKEPSFTFTMIIVDVDEEGDTQAGFIISSNCPVCHSNVLADIIDTNNIPHTILGEAEKSNKVH